MQIEFVSLLSLLLLGNVTALERDSIYATQKLLQRSEINFACWQLLKLRHFRID